VIYLPAQIPNQETCWKGCGVENRRIHCYMDLRQLVDEELDKFQYQ
jgi:hypothetical protein